MDILWFRIMGIFRHIEIYFLLLVSEFELVAINIYYNLDNFHEWSSKYERNLNILLHIKYDEIQWISELVHLYQYILNNCIGTFNWSIRKL